MDTNSCRQGGDKRGTTWEKDTYRKQSKITWMECEASTEKAYLTMYLKVKYGKSVTREALPIAVMKPTEYYISFPKTQKSILCPVNRSVGREVIHTNLRLQFLHHHVQYTIIILEEVTLTHPQCELCDIFFLRRYINNMHQNTKSCATGVESKRQNHVVEYIRR